VIELRVGSRPGELSDVHKSLDSRLDQQLDELFEAAIGMADGEERQFHRSPASYVFEDGAPVGRDMVGFVAFDLVLGIVIGGVMDVSFVVKVGRVNGDNRA
jgi:hypothetical protein